MGERIISDKKLLFILDYSKSSTNITMILNKNYLAKKDNNSFK